MTENSVQNYVDRLRLEAKAIAARQGLPRTLWDPFRHAYTSARLGALNGHAATTGLGLLNEIFSGNTAGESAQDLHNNEVGIRYGREAAERYMRGEYGPRSESGSYDNLVTDLQGRIASAVRSGMTLNTPLPSAAWGGLVGPAWFGVTGRYDADGDLYKAHLDQTRGMIAQHGGYYNPSGIDSDHKGVANLGLLPANPIWRSPR